MQKKICLSLNNRKDNYVKRNTEQGEKGNVPQEKHSEFREVLQKSFVSLVMKMFV